MSFDARNGSFVSSQGGPVYPQPPQGMLPDYQRSFSGMSQSHNSQHGQAIIYTAVYSGVQVYEMEINGVAVMRRRPDSWLNATQILKVAGVEKGKRTKVLEKEILTGEHEKVQGGYGKYQGTWINYRRGREFCRQYGVEDILRPLLDHDMGNDGVNQNGNQVETPTKEQAMAANRKRYYTQSADLRNSQSNTGTFFQNISSTASNALAAMSKVARMNSPAPKRNNAGPPRPPQQPALNTQHSGLSGSQQSVPGLQAERSFEDSTYGTGQHEESQEPPRKKMRPTSPDIMSFSQPGAMPEASMRAATPTEPADSFVYQPHALAQVPTADGDMPAALPPLPHPGDARAEEKQALLLDLFADNSRPDLSKHPALQQLSGADLDMPLDQSAHTALHWAATLARLPLMRLLLSRGASMFRGNIAGETPLMAATQVSNNLDQSCFPELLEILAPLIEVRDAKGRTILHHIAVTCGIKGRAASSKYYLEALLEFLVRSNTAGIAGEGGVSMPRPIGLMRFISEMVNARDISGNTALNLVARIGNRSIIQQLLEVQADPSIPNFKGLRPMDFGIGTDQQPSQESFKNTSESPSKTRTITSKVEETSREIIPSVSSSMTEVTSQFAAELRLLQDRIDTHNSQIRDISTHHNALTTQLDKVQTTLRARQDRKQRIANLRRSIQEMQARHATTKGTPPTQPLPTISDADAEFAVPRASDPNAVPPPVLNARLATYNKLNARLQAHLTQLRARDVELEAKFRKVVALCTGVEEAQVETLLPQLMLAVESEGENDVGRVREFLRRVEGVV